MPDNKRQHFVPQFYLRNFASDPDRRTVGTYNIANDRYIPRASIKGQAYRNYFYGKDGEIEKGFKWLEGMASRVIRKIVDKGALPPRDSEDHQVLLAFIISLNARTDAAADEEADSVDRMTKAVLANVPGAAEHLAHVKFTYPNPAVAALQTPMQLLPMALDLQFKLAVNRTQAELVTSDNPVIKYNKYMETRGGFGSHTGLQSRGLQILVPLSPNHFLVFYDEDVYEVGPRNASPARMTEGDVEALNFLQAINAKENVYFRNCPHMELARLLRAASRHRKRMRMTNVKTLQVRVPDGNYEEVLAFHRTDIRCNLKLSFVHVPNRAWRMDIGSSISPVRDEFWVEMVEKFHARVDAGEYQDGEFPVFIAAEVERLKQRD